jgi:hypothetical protein
MVVVPIKWKILSLQDKLNIMQKGEENLNASVQMFMLFLNNF